MPEDDAEAVRWYRLAADQGLARAQSNLGWMYANGEGVPEDDAEAVRWFRLSADQGNTFAQFSLGSMYENGEGVLRDNVTAHMWFNIAGANGYDMGRNNREKIEKKMTPADISEAQKRARICMASNYTDCDRRCADGAQRELRAGRRASDETTHRHKAQPISSSATSV